MPKINNITLVGCCMEYILVLLLNVKEFNSIRCNVSVGGLNFLLHSKYKLCSGWALIHVFRRSIHSVCIYSCEDLHVLLKS